jgi:C1A family cysteine protease
MREPPRTVQLPAAADLTHECPPIRDQGGLGSCVANSSLEAVGFLYTRAGQADPKLSRLFTYYYTRISEGSLPNEDSGCEIRDAMKGLARMGSCLETTWPYLDDGSFYAVEPTVAARAEALTHQLLFYYKCPSLRTVKASIAQGFPVVQSDACAKTGIVKYPLPSEAFVGGHAVLFVGYDDAKSLLKAQNSWGAAWGDHGYLYLPYRFAAEGLADDFWTVRRAEEP